MPHRGAPCGRRGSGYFVVFEQVLVDACHIPPFFSQSDCVLYCERSPLVDGLADVPELEPGVEPLPVDGLADGEVVDVEESEPEPVEGVLVLPLPDVPPEVWAAAITGSRPSARTSMTNRHFFIAFLLESNDGV